MLQPTLLAVVVALGLGALASLALLPFRHLGLARRALFAAWLAAAAAVVAALLGAVASAPSIERAGDAVPAFARAARAVRDILVVNALVQLVDFVGWELVLRRIGRGRAVSRLVVNLVNVAVLLLAALGILNAHYPARLDGILITSTVLSAIVGLALQDMLSSVAAGVALQLEGTVAMGDWVTIGAVEGEVVQLNWRTLTVRTRDDDLVTIPNGTVTRGEVINHSRPTPLHVDDVDLAVGYPHVPSEVVALLRAAAADAPGVVTPPMPRVRLQRFGDSALHYRIRFSVSDMPGLPETRSQVLRRALYAMRRAGHDIPTSNLDVRLERATDAATAAERAAAVAERAAALRPAPILAALSDEEIAALAEQAVEARFDDGERIIRQGEPGETLFVVRRGAVRVSVAHGGLEVEVAERAAGDAFGEMSLFAGAPRSATVSAIGDVELLVLDRAAFRGVLLANPEVAGELARIVGERSAETEARAEEAASAAPTQRPADFLERLRALLGLP